jgi:hypothetical protein
MSEGRAIPDERGGLVPPRRIPPTAIGTLTPEPPGRNGRTFQRSYTHFAWRSQRSSLVLATGSAVALFGPSRLISAAGMLLIGIGLADPVVYGWRAWKRHRELRRT